MTGVWKRLTVLLLAVLLTLPLLTACETAKTDNERGEPAETSGDGS